jgi:hypothetical protein
MDGRGRVDPHQAVQDRSGRPRSVCCRSSWRHGLPGCPIEKAHPPDDLCASRFAHPERPKNCRLRRPWPSQSRSILADGGSQCRRCTSAHTRCTAPSPRCGRLLRREATACRNSSRRDTSSGCAARITMSNSVSVNAIGISMFFHEEVVQRDQQVPTYRVTTQSRCTDQTAHMFKPSLQNLTARFRPTCSVLHTAGLPK